MQNILFASFFFFFLRLSTQLWEQEEVARLSSGQSSFLFATIHTYFRNKIKIMSPTDYPEWSFTLTVSNCLLLFVDRFQSG